MPHDRFAMISIGTAVALFLAILLFVEIGRRLGIRHRAEQTQTTSGVGPVDGIVYALLSLLIGFTFAGAASRFDKRRELMVSEINAFSTAWQRIDLFPPEMQQSIRNSFRAYLDALLRTYAEAPGTPAEVRERAAATQAQKDLWTRVVAGALDPAGDKARVLIMPSINEVFDAVDVEHYARMLHPPMLIYIMLGVAALAAALFAGYGMSPKPRNWIYIMGVAATISIATWVILELESTRLGLVRVDAMDQALVELRATMR
jgi:hypothetical protein